MPRVLFAWTFALALTPALRAGDWSQFRGPDGNGHADAKLPTEWGAKANVAWRKELPGVGWSSPVTAGGRVYVTTAVREDSGYSLRAVCLDAKTGGVVWDVEVFKQNADAPKIHAKNSHASPSAVVEEGRVYVHFGHSGTACLDAKEGTKVWATQELAYKPVHGNGGSPVVSGKHLIFSVDGTDKQAIIALDKGTGKVAWQTPRKATTGANPFSFSTPQLIKVKDQEQLISAGSGVVVSLDPKTGKEFWRVNYGGGYSVVPKPVFANGLVYVCTGYNTANLVAIKPDGKGDVTATHVAFTVKKNVPHNPSVIAAGDALYMVSDNGTLSCLDAKTGAERWTERVGGNFSASPLYANDLIYLLDEAGTATVFRPGDSYDEVAKNKLGERALASFGVTGDAILLRTEKALYKIGKK